MKRKSHKLIYSLLCFLLIFQQTGFAQVASVELNIAGHLQSLRSNIFIEQFRPLHLRYISYDSLNNNFKLLLDKGNFLSSPLRNDGAGRSLEEETKKLLNYFFVGIALPNDTFWVNLRPDSPDNIIDPLLAQTEVGRILLEADLQLKKDTANATNPGTLEGKEYWNKLYQKAEELYGNRNVTIPTLTRPWIVPDEIIIRESIDSAYVHKATLKVMLEQDYLKGNTTYSFKDEREKQLNEYSSQIIRENIIPKLTKEINNAKRYAPLRQVYYSLILAQWFKARNSNKNTQYARLINRKDLAGLQSQIPYSAATYFNAYKENFEKGEYNIKELTNTTYGQVIRSYFSGGITDIAPVVPGLGEPAPVNLTGGVVVVPVDKDPRVSSNDIDASFDGRNLVIGRSGNSATVNTFSSAWETGNPISISESHLRVLTDRTGFRVPEVRLISSEVMDTLAGGRRVLRQGNRIFISIPYWNSLSDQDQVKLDIFIHEAMADWLELRGLDAQDAPVDLEHGVPLNQEDVLKAKEARRQAHLASVDDSIDGTGLADPNEVNRKVTDAMIAMKKTGKTGQRDALTNIAQREAQLGSWKGQLERGEFPEFSAIGDVHGDLGRLKQMIDDLEAKGIRNFVFCGDFMDRGTENVAVFEFVKRLKEEGRAICLLGNHDLWFVQAMLGDPIMFNVWITNGGLKVLNELGIAGGDSQFINWFNAARSNAKLQEMAKWMQENLQLFHVNKEGVLFIHAGIPLDNEGNVRLEFRGHRGIEALKAMESDLRNATSSADSIFNVLNSPLSPVLVRIGWLDIIKRKGVADKVLNQLGVNAIVFAHSPQEQLLNVQNKIFGIDLKLARAMGGRGGNVVFGRDGIVLNKFEGGNLSSNPILTREALLRELDLRIAGLEQEKEQEEARQWGAALAQTDKEDVIYNDFIASLDEAESKLIIGLVTAFETQDIEAVRSFMSNGALTSDQYPARVCIDSYLRLRRDINLFRLIRQAILPHNVQKKQLYLSALVSLRRKTDALIEKLPASDKILGLKVLGEAAKRILTVFISSLTPEQKKLIVVMSIAEKIPALAKLILSEGRAIEELGLEINPEIVDNYLQMRQQDIEQFRVLRAMIMPEDKLAVYSKPAQDLAGKTNKLEGQLSVISNGDSTKVEKETIRGGLDSPERKFILAMVLALDEEFDAAVAILWQPGDAADVTSVIAKRYLDARNQDVNNFRAKRHELIRRLRLKFPDSVETYFGGTESSVMNRLKLQKESVIRRLADTEDHALEGNVTREEAEEIARLADSSGARRITLPNDIIQELEQKFGPGRVGPVEVMVVAQPFMHTQSGRPINGPVRLGNRIFIGDEYFAQRNNDLRFIISELGHEAMAQWVVERRPDLTADEAHELAVQMEAIFRIEQGLLAERRIEEVRSQASVPQVVNQVGMGGIDFRFLPIVTQSMDGLKVNIRAMSQGSLQRIDLTREWSDIERLVKSGITPSAERLKDYFAASCFKGSLDSDMDKIVSCISDILRIQEESCCAADPILKDIFVVLGSGRSGKELKTAFLN